MICVKYHVDQMNRVKNRPPPHALRLCLMGLSSIIQVQNVLRVDLMQQWLSQVARVFDMRHRISYECKFISFNKISISRFSLAN